VSFGHSSHPFFLPTFILSASAFFSGLSKRFSEDAGETKRRQQKEKEAKLEAQQRAWAVIMPNLEARKGSDEVKKLCWQGIPSNLRKEAWPLLVGNALQITKELYEIFAGHAFNARIKYEASRESRERGEDVSHEEDVSQSPQQAERQKITMRISKEASMHLISQDIPRTFPELSFFHDETG
jgi:hypothetical protein